MKKKNLTSLSEFIDKEVGKKGTKKRDKFESDYESFKLGVDFGKQAMSGLTKK